MVTTAEALSVLVPDANPLTDYTVIADGASGQITRWSLPVPQPTAEQLAAVTAEQVQQARTARLTLAAIQWVAGSMDPPAVAVRVLLRDVYTQLNDARELHGLPRILEPVISARLVALAQAGGGLPFAL